MQTVLDRKMYKNALLRVRKNEITLFDSLFSIGHKFYNYFNISKSEVLRAIPGNPNKLFEITI